MKKNYIVSILILVLSCSVLAQQQSSGVLVPIIDLVMRDDEAIKNNGVSISGEMRLWHRITLDVIGPQLSETSADNPFTDYRLEVVFENGAESFVVPGFFAADGNAAETSATSGNVWRTRFAPNKTGIWSYTYRFYQGDNVAINGGGTPVSGIHGLSGTFNISTSNKTGQDFRGKGRLEYVGEHYLKHATSGEYFIKVGADAPEGLLGYADFDNTQNQNGSNSGIKTFTEHVSDWQSGDPVWQGTKGKGLIGALNYLASEEQNAFSFLTYSYGGDSKTVWPFIGGTDRFNYDVSKLAQWEIIFSHADTLGLYLHFKLQETENDNHPTTGLDAGAVGPERKLYYRELIARFGHHLGLNWNLGEENTQTDQQRKDMAQYFYDNDPYHHNIVVHTYPGDHDEVYEPLLGNNSKLTGASIQTSYTNVHRDTLEWLGKSAAAGKKWIVANDEQGSANIGAPPDDGYNNFDASSISVSQYNIRHETLWGNLMAGGAGVEYYFGYQVPCTDLTCEDYRSRDKMWDYNRYALQFFKTYLPFTEMANCNELIDNSSNNDNDGYCFGKVGEVYAVYLHEGQLVELDLTSVSGNYAVQWYNPRSGGALASGSQTVISGGSLQSLGTPPITPPPGTSDDNDWVVLVTQQ